MLPGATVPTQQLQYLVSAATFRRRFELIEGSYTMAQALLMVFSGMHT